MTEPFNYYKYLLDAQELAKSYAEYEKEHKGASKLGIMEYKLQESVKSYLQNKCEMTDKEVDEFLAREKKPKEKI